MELPPDGGWSFTALLVVGSVANDRDVASDMPVEAEDSPGLEAFPDQAGFGGRANDHRR
jgi:hypothetical protein